ncbi:MAG: PIN domain-containing protein [Spirochaetaceae bacterium]|jgi:predicted nucleic acid-binding protein|nr:PIN domain-containing protein [Spirochaetaceae bacterium]
MVKQKVYLETTMFNYYFDTHKEANPATIKFFEAINSGQFEAYTSIYAVEELENAPEPKRSNMLNLISKYNILVLPGSNEALNLAKKYISSGIIPEKKLIDALQIAIASLHGISMILSFNFSHINKVKTKIMVPAVNQIEGFQNIIITQPQEVIDYE